MFKEGLKKITQKGILGGKDKIKEKSVSPKEEKKEVHGVQEMAIERAKFSHPEAGRIAHDGLTFALSATPGEIRRAPLLGEHNDYVYKEILGFSEDEVNQLITDSALE